MAYQMYQIDAFTDNLFGGNPAAVVPLDTWLPDALMQSIALENNLSETAFIVPSSTHDYHIRWFTPTDEVRLCGHATLAATYVIFLFLRPELSVVRFDSLSGTLKVMRDADWLTLDFPAWAREETPVPQAISNALGVIPGAFYTGNYMMAVLKDEAAVRRVAPDAALLKKAVPLGLIVTAPGDEVDFVSRSFFPSIGVDEDPVTGSSHCMLTPYWAKRLRKTNLIAQQVSARGGALKCRMEGERVQISGKAVLYLKGEIFL